MSSDCGNSWSASVLDFHELGITLSDSTLVRDVDRPELYVDPFEDRIFVSTTVGSDAAQAHVTVEGRPKVAVNRLWTVIRNGNFDAAPRVMTTVRDELTPFSILASARCAFGRPMLDLETPVGSREFDLAAGGGEPCGQVDKGTNGMPFNQMHAGPGIAAISSSPPRLLVAFAGVSSTSFQTLRLYFVTLRSAAGYVRPPRRSSRHHRPVEPKRTRRVAATHQRR
jgi:hypothetical protein